MELDGEINNGGTFSEVIRGLKNAILVSKMEVYIIYIYIYTHTYIYSN